MYPNWRSICGTISLAASLALLGCGSTTTSNVRAVNASPGFAPFTFQVSQIGIGSIPYGTEGVQPKGDNYSKIDSSGNYRIVGTGTNQPVSTYVTPGTTVVSVKQTLVKNASYTIVSYGSSPTMGLAVLTDNNSAPAGGQYNLRFLNYASHGPVDVYITAVGSVPSGTPTIGNVDFNNQSLGYLPLPPGTWTMQITQAGDPSIVLATAPFSPAGGQIYSVFFVDPNAAQPPPNSGLAGYGILVVNDPISTTTSK